MFVDRVAALQETPVEIANVISPLLSIRLHWNKPQDVMAVPGLRHCDMKYPVVAADKDASKSCAGVLVAEFNVKLPTYLVTRFCADVILFPSVAVTAESNPDDAELATCVWNVRPESVLLLTVAENDPHVGVVNEVSNVFEVNVADVMNDDGSNKSKHAPHPVVLGSWTRNVIVLGLTNLAVSTVEASAPFSSFHPNFRNTMDEETVLILNEYSVPA